MARKKETSSPSFSGLVNLHSSDKFYNFGSLDAADKRRRGSDYGDRGSWHPRNRLLARASIQLSSEIREPQAI
jgi:hypothetical protein